MTSASRPHVRAGTAAFGILTLALSWGVMPHLPLPPFAGHMTIHMLVVAVAAPLLALSVAGSALDPAARAPRCFSAIVASMVELVIVWGWHAPALHRFARHALGGLVLEQASFLATGLFLWISALGSGTRESRERAVGAVTGLLLTSMHMTLLGALLVLTPRPLFAHPHASVRTQLGPALDQQLGGAIMLILGGATYLAGALWLTARALRPAGRQLA